MRFIADDWLGTYTLLASHRRMTPRLCSDNEFLSRVAFGHQKRHILKPVLLPADLTQVTDNAAKETC